jgi:cytochrome P450
MNKRLHSNLLFPKNEFYSFSFIQLARPLTHCQCRFLESAPPFLSFAHTSCIIQFLLTKLHQTDDTTTQVAMERIFTFPAAFVHMDTIAGSLSLWIGTPTQFVPSWWRLALFFAVCVIISWVTTSRNPKRKKSWPVVPWALPLLGNSLAPMGVSGFHSKVAEWASLYGIKDNPTGILECSIFGRKFYIICNNDLAVKIMTLRPHSIRKNPNVTAAAKSMGADGVFAADGMEWQHDRRLVAPALSRKAVMDYMPHLKIITGRLLAKWKEEVSQSPSHTIVINHDLGCMAVDTIGRIAFGVEYNALGQPDSQEVKDVQFIFDRIVSRMFSPFKLWRLPFLARILDPEASQVLRRMTRNFSNIIEKEQIRQQQQQQQQQQNQSLLDETTEPTMPTFLSKVVSKFQGRHHHPRLHGNLTTMFIAGSDTTSSALMICLYKIASDQTGLQHELLEEANLLPDLECPSLTLNLLMDAVPRIRSLFYEVVRYMGPAPQLMLQNDAALEVSPGVSVPAGSNLILPLQFLGTLEGSGIPVGPRQSPIDTFCARRWLDMNHHSSTTGKNVVVQGVVKPSSTTSISTGFGGGVRICPGQVLAEAEAVLCVAYVARQFHLSLPPDHVPIQMTSRLVAAPKDDIRLILQERRLAAR